MDTRVNEIGALIVRRLELIGHLDDQDRAAVLSLSGQIRTVRRGTDVLKFGEHPTESVVVLDGFLYRYKLMPQGGRQIHSFYLPGDTPSLEAIPLERMDNSLATMVESRVGFIPHPELCRILGERPNVMNLIWRETLVQAATFREWLTRNSLLPADMSMAHLFCEIMIRAKANGWARGNSCDLPVTQQDLSDALGMSVVHANRTLMTLRNVGVELKGGVLTVENLEALKKLAAFDPTYLHMNGTSHA